MKSENVEQVKERGLFDEGTLRELELLLLGSLEAVSDFPISRRVLC